MVGQSTHQQSPLLFTRYQYRGGVNQDTSSLFGETSLLHSKSPQNV